jgi:uncharacterized membrane protein YgdD (TMEM256/DUF423 family)
VKSRTILIVGALLMLDATAAGAFGAHWLKPRLAPDLLHAYETAVQYQFFQALGLLAMGLAARAQSAPSLGVAAAVLTAGIVLFSGGLYAFALGAPRAIVILAPLGGALLMGAWVLFAVALWRTPGTD